MSAIKLLYLGIMRDGTIRLQSQMLLGKSVADFIIEDTVLKIWRYGNHGIDFYPFNDSYMVVANPKEMIIQEL